eukprot:TRINITY_DN18748_c0_g1_i1.p2 TRINITY_DN18748_c0_g1~~TRINITY_DN18748_c0_g1_i1.p2  ORF type:complete len:127 (+),score=18.31 TRINITY_DN18748_c0_g1_i1:176-556(+)
MLDLGNQPVVAAPGVLAQVTRLGQLKTLVANKLELTDQDLLALIPLPLDHVHVECRHLTPAGIRAFVAAAGPDRLWPLWFKTPLQLAPLFDRLAKVNSWLHGESWFVHSQHSGGSCQGDEHDCNIH